MDSAGAKPIPLSIKKNDAVDSNLQTLKDTFKKKNEELSKDAVKSNERQQDLANDVSVASRGRLVTSPISPVDSNLTSATNLCVEKSKLASGKNEANAFHLSVPAHIADSMSCQGTHSAEAVNAIDKYVKSMYSALHERKRTGQFHLRPATCNGTNVDKRSSESMVDSSLPVGIANVGLQCHENSDKKATAGTEGSQEAGRQPVPKFDLKSGASFAVDNKSAADLFKGFTSWELFKPQTPWRTSETKIFDQNATTSKPHISENVLAQASSWLLQNPIEQHRKFASVSPFTASACGTFMNFDDCNKDPQTADQQLLEVERSRKQKSEGKLQRDEEALASCFESAKCAREKAFQSEGNRNAEAFKRDIAEVNCESVLKKQSDMKRHLASSHIGSKTDNWFEAQSFEDPSWKDKASEVTATLETLKKIYLAAVANEKSGLLGTALSWYPRAMMLLHDEESSSAAAQSSEDPRNEYYSNEDRTNNCWTANQVPSQVCPGAAIGEDISKVRKDPLKDMLEQSNTGSVTGYGRTVFDTANSTAFRKRTEQPFHCNGFNPR